MNSILYAVLFGYVLINVQKLKHIYALMKKICMASSSANCPQKIRVIIRFPPSLGLPLSEHLGAC